MNKPTAAFTLIELLVVITIVVVLLALLAPALDKAVYHGELAVCGSNLHGIGVGAIFYASDHKRSYPGHGRDQIPQNAQVLNASDPNPNPDGLRRFDLRRIVPNYMQYEKLFLDPLSGKIDLTVNIRGLRTPTATDPLPVNALTLVYANYLWYFHWGYPGEERMTRLGGRFSYRNDRFNVLAADPDIRHDTQGWFISSHPDADDRATFRKYHDEDPSWSGAPQVRITASWWGSGRERGDLDHNYLFDDGSVVRINGLKRHMPSMVEVADHQNLGDSAARKVQLPAPR